MTFANTSAATSTARTTVRSTATAGGGLDGPAASWFGSDSRGGRKALLIRLAGLMALAFLLTACNALKLGYENLPRLVEWQVDNYLDLDDEQEALVTRKAKDIQRWHRQNLLPVYAEFLHRVEEELRTPVTVRQVAEWRQTVVRGWLPVADQLAPAVAEVALTLRPEQLAHLRRAIVKANEKAAAEYRPSDPAKRHEARYKRLVKRSESFFGDISDEQKRLIRESAASMAANEDAWWQARVARQAAIVELLAGLATEKPAADEAVKRARLVLAGLFRPHDAQPGQAATVAPASAADAAAQSALRNDLAAASTAGDELTVRLLAIAPPEQRRHLGMGLDGYRLDFHLLAAR